MNYPSQEFLQEMFNYEDGMLFYKKNPPRSNLVNKRAGTKSFGNYRQVTIAKKKFFEHRLIWILLNGTIPNDLVIDHIDRDPSNNKIENLRVISQAGNTLNRSTTTHVQKWAEDKWYARFKRFGKTNSKFFSTKEEAENWVISQKEYLIKSESSSKRSVS